jgi:hypothetical protein
MKTNILERGKSEDKTRQVILKEEIRKTREELT